METKVRLEKLPQGVGFPETLTDRIHFDSERKLLVFDGFMSKSVYDSLCQLSREDAYRRAIEVLFRDSSKQLQPAGTHGPSLATIFAVGALALTACIAVAIWLF